MDKKDLYINEEDINFIRGMDFIVITILLLAVWKIGEIMWWILSHVHISLS